MSDDQRTAIYRALRAENEQIKARLAEAQRTNARDQRALEILAKLVWDSTTSEDSFAGRSKADWIVWARGQAVAERFEREGGSGD